MAMIVSAPSVAACASTSATKSALRRLAIFFRRTSPVTADEKEKRQDVQKNIIIFPPNRIGCQMMMLFIGT